MQHGFADVIFVLSMSLNQTIIAKIRKFHLDKGVIVAIVLPAIFSFDKSRATTSDVLLRYIAIFALILCFWTITFAIVDFKKAPANKDLRFTGNRYLQVLLAILACYLVYITLGVAFKSSTLLIAVSGDAAYSLNAWFYLSLRIIMFVALFLVIKYLFDSNEEKQQVKMENEVLKRENLKALHETLKQQVNPHFLFNSLNTLKSLIKRDPSQATQFTEQLASVYRYMLLHANQQKVHLSEEMEFLKSYLFLLKIRFGEAIFTQIDVPEAFADSLMPPNTLQLLIENAVKHNSLSLHRPLHIGIFVKDKFLVVRNNLQEKEAAFSSSHIGLNNINSRYLLHYGEEIIIERTEQYFQVSLPIFKSIPK